MRPRHAAGRIFLAPPTTASAQCLRLSMGVFFVVVTSNLPNRLMSLAVWRNVLLRRDLRVRSCALLTDVRWTNCCARCDTSTWTSWPTLSTSATSRTSNSPTCRPSSPSLLPTTTTKPVPLLLVVMVVEQASIPQPRLSRVRPSRTERQHPLPTYRPLSPHPP